MARKPSPTNDEEINYDEGLKFDFGKYIDILVRQWQWIVVCALGLGILALAFLLFYNRFNPTYSAIALVASARTESSANFGSAITSESDTQLALAAYTDRETRLQSFVSQVQNGAVAEQVLEEVGPLGNKKGASLSTSALLDMVSAELIPNTDTIQISVEYYDPVIAAEIANAWAKAYVQRINDLYGGTSGTSSLATQAEVTQAKAGYDKAEAALDDFIAHDKTAEYTRQVEALSEIVDQVYIDRHQIGLFLDSAISMRAAVIAGGEPAAISNALALTMLKTQIYAAYEGTNTLQVQNLPEALGSNISTVNASGMVADLDALIATLETRYTELNNLIDAPSSEKKIEEYEQKIRDLNSLISAQTSTLDELIQMRDLTWKSYSALATKAIEMSVIAQNIQVVFASPATPPAETVATPAQKIALLAAGVGLLIGIIVAFAYETWQNYKGRPPESITKKMVADVKNLVIKKPINSQKA